MASTIIAKTGIKKKKGYLYFIDKSGHVRQTMMAQYSKAITSDRKRHTSSTLDGVARKRRTTAKRATAKRRPAKK